MTSDRKVLYNQAKRHLLKALQADPSLAAELESAGRADRLACAPSGLRRGVFIALALLGVAVLALAFGTYVVRSRLSPAGPPVAPGLSPVPAPGAPEPAPRPSPRAEPARAPAPEPPPVPEPAPAVPKAASAKPARAPVAEPAPVPSREPVPVAPKAVPIKSGPERGGIEWVTIPGGSFMMGAGAMGAGADGSLTSTKPAHRVTVPSFQLARTEVTFGQYRQCVAAGACTPAHVSDGACWSYDESGSNWARRNLPAAFQGDDQPVVCVDWEQAKAFAKWAGGSLPSEAEWEYAARSAGRDIKYPWGDETASCAKAVINDSASGGQGCGRKTTWPVCSKHAGNTEQGVCDMAGNVWEWTQDWYHDSYNGAPDDGSAWESPAASHRVDRGGSWNFDAGYARAAFRYFVGPGIRDADLGLRPRRSSR